MVHQRGSGTGRAETQDGKKEAEQGSRVFERKSFAREGKCMVYYKMKNGQFGNGRGWIMNYTYILKCSDGSLYTGWTNDLDRRINDHNAGKGAKYTKARRPVELAYYETFSTKEEAMKREYAIKQMTRRMKLKMIEERKSSM